MQKPKRKPGRPKLPKGQAKGKIVPVRFRAIEIEAISVAAKNAKLTVSQWIRNKLAAAREG